MNESQRNEIISRWRAGASIRRIARELGLARNTVGGVLEQVQARRAGTVTGSTAASGPAGSTLRAGQKGPADPLSRPHRRATPGRVAAPGLHRRLHHRPPAARRHATPARARSGRPLRDGTGSPGPDGLRRLRHRLQRRRPAPRPPVQLRPGYSRRQYLRFVEAQDLPTTFREHVRAFEHLGGVAATCLTTT